MQSERDNLAKMFIDLLLKCRLIEKQIAFSARMTVDELHALILFHTQKQPRVGRLSATLGVRDTRMSRILNALEEKGYLVRQLSPVDRRVEEVSLTPRGIRAAEDVLTKSEAISRKLFASRVRENNQVLPELIEELATNDWSTVHEANAS